MTPHEILKHLRTFRTKRDLFAAHVLVRDLVKAYPAIKVCEKIDAIEQWHWRRAHAAMQLAVDSQREFMHQVYLALPPQSRRRHDPHWLPQE
jgi:hypothetical protein